MICYNARVMLRVVVLAACLFSGASAFAQPVGLTTDGHAVMTVSSAGIPGNWVLDTNGKLVLDTSGSAVTGTSGSMVPGMKPGVPGTPGAKHPYFFAAYAVVWLVLFAYVLWLANRIKTLERRR